MSETNTLRIDLLKPHVQALLDEVRRTGPKASRAAVDEIEAKLPDELAKVHDNPRAEQLGTELRSAYTSPPKFESIASVAMSCAGLYTLSAVAYQLYLDHKDDVDQSVPAGYLLDSADYRFAAMVQGCNSHE